MLLALAGPGPKRRLWGPGPGEGPPPPGIVKRLAAVDATCKASPYLTGLHRRWPHGFHHPGITSRRRAREVGGPCRQVDKQTRGLARVRGLAAPGGDAQQGAQTRRSGGTAFLKPTAVREVKPRLWGRRPQDHDALEPRQHGSEEPLEVRADVGPVRNNWGETKQGSGDHPRVYPSKQVLTLE